MTKKLPKAVRQARSSVLAKVSCEDFTTMSQSAYANWINALPVPEFMALLDLHAEAFRGLPVEPEPEYVAPYTADAPTEDDWIGCIGVDQPIGNDLIVWVKFVGGDTSGPDRAGAFFWDGEFIIAYAVASNPKRREEDDE